jgi:hypothetical protein
MYVNFERLHAASIKLLKLIQSNYTMGPDLSTNTYHVLAIRGGLTRNLGRCFPEVRDEIVHAFDDVLALEGKGVSCKTSPYYAIFYAISEWKGLLVMPTMMQIIARTTNRLFVGLPLCEML